MKIQTLMTLTILLASYNVFSITGRDNWSTIKSSHEVIIQQPIFAGAFGPQGLFNACATDEEFRSISPVKVCLSYKQVLRTSITGAYKDYECNHYEMRNIVIARTFTQEECVKNDRIGECIEYDSVTSVYPTSFQLPVISFNEGALNNFIFSKAYAVERCN